MYSESRLRRDALSIFRASLQAADPEQAILRHLAVDGPALRAGGRRYDLNRFDRVLVIGAGKASARMARAVERLLGGRIAAGLINTKYGHLEKLRRIELNECGHPLPDRNGVEGARRIAEIAASAGPRDLLLCLISGGGSALLPLPAQGVSLDEVQAATRLLLACGAAIREINAVRKHISALQGGQLARLASPATVLALLLSDVIGDPLDVIASGPAAPDDSTYASAWSVIGKYGLASRIPASVRARLEAGMRGDAPETPKPGDPCFERVRNLIVGSNRLAVDAAVRRARDLGYRPLVLSTTIEGETREAALVHAAVAREILATGRPVKPPCCVISGGETTVTLKGDGLGGRNQEFALACAIALDGAAPVAVLSGGTDGTDGPTDAAGAIASGQTAARARALGLDPAAALANNDSYHFFEALGGLVKTGPTGTNVMDVRLLLAGS
jgi:hydroxypyruvate reductase